MEQLKVLFVDDEVLVRVGLSSIIPWSNYGCEILGEASSGTEALDMIEKEMPHIIFTDILMPNMTGIELIRKIRELYGNSVYIIILTAYDEFEYAQTAIKYGVTDYILKFSMTDKSIVTILEKIKANISNLQPNVCGPEKDHSLKQTINRHFIKMIADKSYQSGNGVADVIGHLLIPNPFDRGSLVVAAISIVKFKKKILEGKIVNDIKFLMDFNNILASKLMLFGAEDVFELDTNTYIFMLDYKKNINLVKDIFDALNFAFGTYLNSAISMGVSSCYDSIENLPCALNESLVALDKSFYSDDAVLNVFETQNDFAADNFFNVDDEDKLYNALSLLQSDLCIQLLQNWLNKCKSKKASKLTVMSNLMRIEYIFLRAVKKFESTWQQLEKGPGLFFENIENSETIFEVEASVYEYTLKFLEFLHIKKRDNNNNEIFKIKEYVQENYMNDISLEIISNHVNLSKNYISAIFKKYTGENFIDYLNHVRIDKANELIVDKNVKVFEAAEMVGFNNINYFSNVFKKIKGVSPSSLKYK